MRYDNKIPALFALALLGCEPTLETGDGTAPEARATLQGTLVYSGPAVGCTDGEVRGRALLLAYSESAPPPPEGSGLPASLYFVPGAELFSSADCRASDEDRRQLTRSVSFTWPNLPLDAPFGGGPAYYRILATWDEDANLNPVYQVRSAPTANDIIGGAFDVGPNGPTPQLITVGPSADHPAGQVVKGLTVAVQAAVNTELPIARLRDATPPLSARTPLPLALNPEVLLDGLVALADTALEFPELAAEPYRTVLDVAGLDLDTSSVARAIHRGPLDLDANGQPDPHPILGPLAGIQQSTPVVIFQRARTPLEVELGLPTVLLMPYARADKEVVSGSVDLALPPIALVLLDGTEACAVPYAAPGNASLVYTQAGAQCAALPTGRYDVNVVHGRAGATAMAADAVRSDVGVVLAGGSLSGQFWRIPNELGPPDTRYDRFALDQLNPPGSGTDIALVEQGDAGRFVVVDGPGEVFETATSSACASAPNPLTGQVETIEPPAVPAACCAAVLHLCALPVCAAIDVDARIIREADETPCLPFELPPSCCP